MRLLSWNIEDRMKTLGYYQIIGGIIGIILTIRLLVYERTLSGLGILFYGGAIALFIYSMFCGNQLRKGNVKGLKLSTWNQVLQIIQFSIAAIGFEYYSGLLFNIGFHWTENFIPDMNFGISGWRFRYTESYTNNLSIYINLIPIIIIYYIGKIEDDIETRKQLIKAAQEETNENSSS